MIVRRATEGDAAPIGDVLAAAFHDYEWTRWTVDARDHAARIAALQRLAFTELVLPFGEAWVAEHDDAIVSAAMWMRADTAAPDDTWAALEPQLAALEGDRHDASRAAEAVLEPFRPITPAAFLGAVGTLPAHQRQGVAYAVLEPVLRRNEPARLETCGAANVAFYEGLGFTIDHEVALPGDAPTVWLMSRV